MTAPAPRPADPATDGPSPHPGAVKARRWRARRAALRRRAVTVEIVVERAEVRDLRRLGLLPGDPYDDAPPDPVELVAALRRLLAAAGPLSELAEALAPEDATDGACEQRG